MKKLFLSMMAAALFTTAFAQESNFGISTDIVSRYVFRGTQFSASPVIQPGMAYSTGGLTLGAWGSYAFDNNAVAEADLYASYAFDFGLSLVATDYFFPKDPMDLNSEVSGGYFDGDNHWFELGASYSISKLTLSAYYMLNQDNDMYFEAGYAFNDNLSATLGAGDMMYSTSDDLNVCNIGLKYKKEVAITETFKVSPYASFIVNPNQEQVFLVVGVTL
jgi:hypothetical protein